MATYTPNYQLHQWEPQDHFLRTEFNEDFSKIDTAIKGVKTGADSAVASVRSELQSAQSSLETAVARKCEVYLGYYYGDGAESRDIYLGFRPNAVLLETSAGIRPDNGFPYGGFAQPDRGLYTQSGNPALIITATGFTIYYAGNSCTNVNGRAYQYLAFR